MKRHTTEEIIRILRKADGGQTVEEVCREANICGLTFYRWRRKFGRMEMADTKRFKELEGENSELKKMLADEMLKNRVLEETLKKVGERPREAAGCEIGGCGRVVLCAPRVPLLRSAWFELPLPAVGGAGEDEETGGADRAAEPSLPTLRLPPDPCPAGR
ncbi:MAG: transposase [Verrucomicrobiales bacterium]|nr:transposase [Verrucomicrobiales bacterium]